jgi:hypothetical protein
VGNYRQGNGVRRVHLGGMPASGVGSNKPALRYLCPNHPALTTRHIVYPVFRSLPTGRILVIFTKLRHR